MYEIIKENLLDIKELELKENQITVLFIPDMMEKGLGDEVIIEIGKLFPNPKRTRAVLQRVAEKVGESLNDYFSKPKWTDCWPRPDLIECFVETFDPFSEN